MKDHHQVICGICLILLGIGLWHFQGSGAFSFRGFEVTYGEHGIHVGLAPRLSRTYGQPVSAQAPPSKPVAQNERQRAPKPKLRPDQSVIPEPTPLRQPKRRSATRHRYSAEDDNGMAYDCNYVISGHR